MKKLIIFSLLSLFSFSLYAQDQKEIERKKIPNLFLEALNRKYLKDTNNIHMFAIKVNVLKDKKGKLSIQSITSNDTSAYLMFKDFNFLKKINYNLFMGNRLQATFVFPVSIILEYPTKENAGLLKAKDVQNELSHYMISSDDFKERAENYIYIMAVNIRTTTWVDY